MLCLICLLYIFNFTVFSLSDEVYEQLPSFEEILAEAKVDKYLNNLIRMSIVDTRLLFLLSRMDYQMMMYEWDGVTKDEINYFEEVVKKYKEIAEQITVEVFVPEIDYSERDTLKFGKLILPDSVQGFDYMQASFGGRPPIGMKKIKISNPEYGCLKDDMPEEEDFTDSLVIVKRGSCTFLEKAEIAFQRNATGIIIVNTIDALEILSSGIGVDRSITDQRVFALSQLSVVSVANTSWHALKYSFDKASQSNIELFGQLIPLKCGVKSQCVPVVEEELLSSFEVSAGHFKVNGGNDLETYDFLTSNFGSRIPNTPVSLLVSDPLDGCSSIQTNVPKSGDWALLVHRGTCPFHTKAMNAEKSGAMLLVVIDVEDNALQRLGATEPHSSMIGIPGIIVTAMAGQTLIDAIDSSPETSITLAPVLDNNLADTWIELAFTKFATTRDALLSQIAGMSKKFEGVGYSNELLQWLTRKAERIASVNIDINGQFNT